MRNVGSGGAAAAEEKKMHFLHFGSCFVPSVSSLSPHAAFKIRGNATCCVLSQERERERERERARERERQRERERERERKRQREREKERERMFCCPRSSSFRDRV